MIQVVRGLPDQEVYQMYTEILNDTIAHVNMVEYGRLPEDMAWAEDMVQQFAEVLTSLSAANVPCSMATGLTMSP